MVLCLLLHVRAEIRHLQAVYTPIFKTHENVIYYNSDAYYIVTFLQLNSEL